MKTIKKQIKAVATIVGAQHYKEGTDYTLSCQCAEATCSEGKLLYHSMTGELLLLEDDDNLDHVGIRKKLVNHWFLVPPGFNEAEQCDQVKNVARIIKNESKRINRYVVFTTTDCNARCFYCFEQGQRRYAMSEQTAKDVADYMILHALGEKISIRWFGGEPLFNLKVIDIISERLQNAGVQYESTMVSNAYLFDQKAIEKANALWNLKHVLITLDGTEEVYNRTKAYIGEDGSAYQRVLNNVCHILDSGISVTFNLNMDAANANNIYELADELGQRFNNNDNLRIRGVLLKEYVGKIHKFKDSKEALYTLCGLNRKLDKYGIREKKLLWKGIMLNSCMADDIHSVTILPDGRIGRCEHFADSESVGCIYEEKCDIEKEESWRVRKPVETSCVTCVHYPLCIRLKKCNSYPQTCNDMVIGEKDMELHNRILNTYENWKKNGEKN